MYISLISRIILILGAFSYAMLHILKLDPINFISINKNFTLIYGIIIITAVSLYIFDRNYYLPFLGPSVIPIKSKETIGKLSSVKIIGLPVNTRIIYWASNPSDEIYPNSIDAYTGYGNSGIAKTNDVGEVSVQINCPSEYIVNKYGFNRKLPKHIHYRIESSKYPGLFSEVKTQNVDCL